LPGSAQALAGEVEPMGIVDAAIEHGVGILMAMKDSLSLSLAERPTCQLWGTPPISSASS